MDFYSRMVAFLKVLLPLAALALLSTVFLLSRGVDPNANIPFAENEIVERLSGQQVTEPFFSGTTSKGEEIRVMAVLARPGGLGKPAEATEIIARLKTKEGSVISLTSDEGDFMPEDDLATFTGNVQITSDSGFVVDTEKLNTSLSSIEGNSPGPISGTGPIGDFQAGAMDMTSKNDDGPIHMLFKKGVTLVYLPQSQER